MYKLMSGISFFIRVFLLPNPFEGYELSFLLNSIIAEPILHVFSFAIVGIFYRKGSAPTFGSLAYLIVYWMLVIAMQTFLSGLIS